MSMTDIKVKMIRQDNATETFKIYEKKVNNFITKVLSSKNEYGHYGTIEQIIPCNTCSTVVYRECIIIYKGIDIDE